MIHDLLVVGGGPAGASCAAFAARAGLRVLVAERAAFPRDKPCAEYLSPEAARDLDALGVLPAIEAAGAARLGGFRLVADDGTAAEGRFAGALPFAPYRPFGYALPRRTLDTLLLEAARGSGAEVREQTQLEELVYDRGGVAGGVLRSGGGREVVRARAVVGADGLHSRVAQRLGLSRRGALRRLALVAHWSDVEGMGDLGEMWAGPGRYAGLAPLGRGLVNVAAVVPLAEGRAIARDPDAFLRSEIARWPALAARTARARVVRGALVAGPFARRCRRAVADGALLVGDAADFYDPFTGEGIFAALRGGRLAAAALAAALDGAGANAAALAPYERARRTAFAGKWVLERVVALAATQPWLMRRFTRRLARHRDIADLWVGAAGDHVPVRALFTPRRLAALVV